MKYTVIYNGSVKYEGPDKGIAEYTYGEWERMAIGFGKHVQLLCDGEVVVEWES